MNKFACGKGVLRICAKGFTLAEVMIVLVVIGVITGILLPTAIQSTPDENVMKFKKGYSTLGQVIRELVTSDKYYQNGDLGIKPDGNLTHPNPKENIKYFCETFSDVLNIKNKNCSEETGRGVVIIGADGANIDSAYIDLENNTNTTTIAKTSLDEFCKQYAITIGEEIKTTDNIIYYQTGPKFTFGNKMTSIQNKRALSAPNEKDPMFRDENKIDLCYKIFCMDIDGIHPNATADDCVNECPFGFGIRADGKILPGARADEWINKSIQKEDD